ncbi:MAG: DUF5685 family protein [Acetivibrionales bacterium]
MFGYVLPEKPELKIREYEMFRAYYCGVCKSIGKRYGQISRLTLNYDSAFLAILISSVYQEKVNIKMERCIVHPVKKRYVVGKSEIIDYSSDINLLLAYYNLEDNWRDEKSVISGIGKLLLSTNFKKLREKYKEKCVIIEDRLKELEALEKEKCSSMDRAAEPFARLMEEVLLYKPVCDSAETEKILRWIGYNLGKWIYILDAYDDIEDNINNKAYNPLLYQYNYSGQEMGQFKGFIKKDVEFNLLYTLDQISKAYELLEIKCNTGILENIIYMGMLRKTEKILGMGGCKEVEKSI